MLDKLKELLKNKETSNKSANNIKDNSNEIIQTFIESSKELTDNANFPAKAKLNLEILVKNLNEVKMDLLTIENQAKIERLLSKEIPEVVDLYFSLPKVHAVSVVLENGKTAKETLIEQFYEYSKRVQDMWTQAIENQSKAIVNQEKMKYKTQEPKKDFFDL